MTDTPQETNKPSGLRLRWKDYVDSARAMAENLNYLADNIEHEMESLRQVTGDMLNNIRLHEANKANISESRDVLLNLVNGQHDSSMAEMDKIQTSHAAVVNFIEGEPEKKEGE